jgi:hypothetical protein
LPGKFYFATTLFSGGITPPFEERKRIFDASNRDGKYGGGIVVGNIYEDSELLKN